MDICTFYDVSLNHKNRDMQDTLTQPDLSHMISSSGYKHNEMESRSL